MQNFCFQKVPLEYSFPAFIYNKNDVDAQRQMWHLKPRSNISTELDASERTTANFIICRENLKHSNCTQTDAVF